MTEGDAIHGADKVRAFGIDGSGVKVGVLSDDVDHLADVQAMGELPDDIRVLRTSDRDGDEGTAMLEIIHDVAREAALYFACGVNSHLGMLDGNLALAASGW